MIPLETALSLWEGALSTGNRAVNPYGKWSLPLDKAKSFLKRASSLRKRASVYEPVWCTRQDDDNLGRRALQT